MCGKERERETESRHFRLHQTSVGMGRTREGSPRLWPSARATRSAALLACCGLVLVGEAVVAERPLISTREAAVAGVARDGSAQEAAEEPFLLTTIVRSLLLVYRHVWPVIPIPISENQLLWFAGQFPSLRLMTPF